MRAFQRDDPSLLSRIGGLWTEMINQGVAHFKIAKFEKRFIGIGAVFFYSTMAWIGYMGVDPFFQRKGVGNKLFVDLIDQIKEKDIRTVRLDASDLGRKMYLKFGLKEEFNVHVHKLCEETQANPPQFNLKVSDNLSKWILKMDKESFGGDRSILLRLLSNHGKIIHVNKKGYGIVTSDKIGPVVADRAEVAIAIVKHAYSLGARTICIPHHKDLSEAFISRLYLKATGIVNTRMILGEKVNEINKNIYAGYSFGTG